MSLAERLTQSRGCSLKHSREKLRADNTRSRTKTDTGRRGEYPKALERTVVKELGNLTPYVRNKGSLQSPSHLCGGLLRAQ